MGDNKAYKYGIYFNINQNKYFLKVFGCIRFLYNKILSDKKSYYEKNKENFSVNPSKYKN
ncbi:hypothetical protein HNP68_001087 [Borrelia yangtzensis]|uniref:Transposase putative helix-turn-helix domain-containing protein n=1 Tax=Borreliella yangtzensis TaxID=683292 RepID=A0ABR6PD13_9SPIR|nr:hypothetical protein [Borreliella yangtzensis]